MVKCNTCDKTPMVYLLDSRLPGYNVRWLADHEPKVFKDLAKKEGRVMTLSEFQDAFNDEDADETNAFILIA